MPETRSFRFTLARDVLNTLLVTEDATSLTNEWTSVMYDEFHKQWPTCAIVFERQYLSRRRHQLAVGEQFWTASSHCKVAGCIRVVFCMLTPADSTADVIVQCDVDGTCSHATQPQGNLVISTTTLLVYGRQRLR